MTHYLLTVHGPAEMDEYGNYRMGRAARCPLCGGSFSARPSSEPRGRLSAYVALQ